MEIHSGPASAYAPHGAALLDYFRNHTSATLSCYQDGGRDDVPGSTVRAISIEGLKSIDPRGECRLWVIRVDLVASLPLPIRPREPTLGRGRGWSGGH
jgi:hypothetical protein